MHSALKFIQTNLPRNCQKQSSCDMSSSQWELYCSEGLNPSFQFSHPCFGLSEHISLLNPLYLSTLRRGRHRAHLLLLGCRLDSNWHLVTFGTFNAHRILIWDSLAEDIYQATIHSRGNGLIILLWLWNLLMVMKMWSNWIGISHYSKVHKDPTGWFVG